LLGDIAVSGALPPAKETKRRLLTSAGHSVFVPNAGKGRRRGQPNYFRLVELTGVDELAPCT